MFAAGMACAALLLLCSAHLPNFARLGLLVPLFAGRAMMDVDVYADWARQPVQAQMRAGMVLFALTALALGTLGWLLFAPIARD